MNTICKSIEVKKLIDPLVDTGNLLFIDRDPFDGDGTDEKLEEEALSRLTRDNVQYLFNEIWKLPRKNVDQTICAELPSGTYALPREKPIPEKRQPTKWEAFAKAKGIVKHRKDRKVFDENTQDWKPRYGYHRASNDPVNKQWMVEIPRQKDPYRDYFTEQKQNKRNQTDRHEFQRLKNVARSMKPTAPRMGANSTPLGIRNTKSSSALSDGIKKQTKHESQELTNQMYRAKAATASAGKFQNSIKGERKPKIGEKRKFAPNATNTTSERQHQLDLFTKLQAKKPKLDKAKFNAVQQQNESAGGDEDGKSGGRQKAGKNAPKRRSAAGAWHKNSQSNKKRQEHFKTMKKGGKQAKSKANYGRQGGKHAKSKESYGRQGNR